MQSVADPEKFDRLIVACWWSRVIVRAFSGVMIRPAGRFRIFPVSDGSVRVGSGRVGSGRVGSGRVGSGRVGSGRVGSGRVGSGRVRRFSSITGRVG